MGTVVAYEMLDMVLGMVSGMVLGMVRLRLFPYLLFLHSFSLISSPTFSPISWSYFPSCLLYLCPNRNRAAHIVDTVYRVDA